MGFTDIFNAFIDFIIHHIHFLNTATTYIIEILSAFAGLLTAFVGIFNFTKKQTKFKTGLFICVSLCFFIVCFFFRYLDSEVIVVPDLSFDTLKEAKDELQNSSLYSEHDPSASSSQEVIGQSPEYGTIVRKWTTVTLQLASPTPTSTPTPSPIPTLTPSPIPTPTPSPTPFPRTVQEFFASPTPAFINVQLNGYNRKSNSYTYIQLGEYQAEPILWRILEIEDDKAFLLSERILEIMDFDDNSNEWNGSNINKWLNGPFLNEIFSKYETSPIIAEPGLEPVFLMLESDLLNPEYGFNNDPSKEDPNRSAIISTFVKNTYLDIDVKEGRLIYYTRNKSSSSNNESLAAVMSSGKIQSAKYDRFSNGKGVGIRPAIYINTETTKFWEGNGTFEDPYR